MNLSRIRIQYQFLLMITLWAGVNAGTLMSQTPTSYQPDQESRLWIEGRSNLQSFECEANDYSGQALIYEDRNRESISQNTNAADQISIRLDIEVHGFECGKNRMNRDLRNALKADEFASITFIYSHAERLPDYKASSNGELSFEVSGTLTVAGTTREVTFKTKGYDPEDGRIRITGSKQIRMTDYQVEPPTGFFGLIKVEDELTVHFDLFVKNS